MTTKERMDALETAITEQSALMLAIAKKLSGDIAPTVVPEIPAQEKPKPTVFPKHIKYPAPDGSYVKFDEKQQAIIIHAVIPTSSLRLNDKGKASVGRRANGFVNAHDWIGPMFSSDRPSYVAIAKANGGDE